MFSALVIVHDLDLVRVALAELEADPPRSSVNGRAREPVPLDVIVSIKAVSPALRLLHPVVEKFPPSC
jgi:hypothetical protein